MDEIEILVEEADLNEVKDSGDRGAVLNLLAAACRQAEELPFQYALHLFEIGVLLNSAEEFEISMRDLVELTGFRKSLLVNTGLVASLYNGNKEEFGKDYKKYKCKNWTDFINFIQHKERRSLSVENKEKYVNEYLNDRIREFLDNNEELGIREFLLNMRDKISRYIPPDISIIANDYLQYSACACCKEFKPEIKMKQLNDKHSHILYPICNDCDEIGRSPDKDYIIQMYAAYAFRLRSDYYKLRDLL